VPDPSKILSFYCIKAWDKDQLIGAFVSLFGVAKKVVKRK
jgi:hypothetical protein